jgi:hypothetical protein
MAQNDKQLNVSDLEFGNIKKNIKDFLRDQDTFTDYDFEGSGMSVMLDVMAYTTHYMGFHANMAINESFLDTATLRNSVVSHAKTIGYTPSSVTSSEAIIKLSFNTTGLDPSSIPVEKGTTFTSTVNGNALQFVALETVNIYPDESGDFTGEIKVNQGTLKGLEWTVDGTDTQSYLIRDAGCDRSTIALGIIEPPADFSVPWTNNELLSELVPFSQVWFVQEGLDEVTEIYFGNGIFGKKPKLGQKVSVVYLSTDGEIGNYTSTLRDQVFSLDVAIGGDYDSNRVTIETVNASNLGDSAESTESIRQTAPKSYERQNRAVTAEDYKTILLEKYPNIDSISVWGGEDNDPPQYGAVFISIKPKHGLELSPITKNHIKDDILSKYNMLAITPIIVTPEYTYIDIETTVNYDPLTTSLSLGEIQNEVRSSVASFFESEITEFKVDLKFSKMTRVIDDAESSITNNTTTLKIYKKFYTQSSNTIGNYIFKFNNKLNPGSVVSSVFGSTVDGSQMALLDDGQGNVLLYDIIAEGFINTSQGSIDYEEGTIELIGFSPVLDNNTVISLYATPKVNDISTIRNNLLVLNSTNVIVKPI